MRYLIKTHKLYKKNLKVKFYFTIILSRYVAVTSTAAVYMNCCQAQLGYFRVLRTYNKNGTRYVFAQPRKVYVAFSQKQ